MPRYQVTSRPDYFFLAIVGVILAFGLIMLASASAPIGYEQFGDSYYFLKHQILFGLVPGLIGLYAFSRVPFFVWKRYAWELLLVSIGLLVLVFIPGVSAGFGTSHSWISFFGLFSVQPAEIVKLTFLFYLAAWLEERGERGVKTSFVPFVSVLGAIMFLIALQPDVGTMSIIVAMSLVVYFVAGAPLLHVGGFVAGGAVLLALLIGLAPYRAARFTTFLYPELDPQGIGYHINQALLAIGSGGFWGVGYGHSRQKFQYLPEVSGDSIFAIIGEELGFIFSVLIIVAFLFFFRRAVRIAMSAPDVFGKLVVIGIASWICIQALVNIGSMVGVMPMTGVTLPFVSYGGSSLAISMCAIGVVLNISRYAKK